MEDSKGLLPFFFAESRPPRHTTTLLRLSLKGAGLCPGTEVWPPLCVAHVALATNFPQLVSDLPVPIFCAGAGFLLE